MMSAEEARAQLDKILETNATNEIANIEVKIKEAISKNKDNVYIKEISVKAKAILEAAGYKVTHYNGGYDSYPQYNIKF